LYLYREYEDLLVIVASQVKEDNLEKQVVLDCKVKGENLDQQDPMEIPDHEDHQVQVVQGANREKEVNQVNKESVEIQDNQVLS